MLKYFIEVKIFYNEWMPCNKSTVQFMNAVTNTKAKASNQKCVVICETNIEPAIEYPSIRITYENGFVQKFEGQKYKIHEILEEIKDIKHLFLRQEIQKEMDDEKDDEENDRYYWDIGDDEDVRTNPELEAMWKKMEDEIDKQRIYPLEYAALQMFPDLLTKYNSVTK